MINSRNLNQLHPAVAARAARLLRIAKENGVNLLVTSTLRDHESQDALYAQGRTVSGNRVTNARGGDSFHNYGLAFDVVPIRFGKPVWGTSGEDAKLWEYVGQLGELVGLQWAGRWQGGLREMAHFQDSGGLNIAQLKAGINPVFK
jgi:peptidoglycan LD-endopeptidase CwlK